MAKIILLCGPSGLGKTRFANKTYPSDSIISFKQLAAQYDDNFNFIFEEAARQVRVLLDEGATPVLDHTFLTFAERKAILKLLPAAIIDCHFFFSTLEATLLSNIPEETIRRQYATIEYPIVREGFSKIIIHNCDEDFNFNFDFDSRLSTIASGAGLSVYRASVLAKLGPPSVEQFLCSEYADTYTALLAQTVIAEKTNPSIFQEAKTKYGGWFILYCNYIKQAIAASEDSNFILKPLPLNASAIMKGI